MAARPSTDELTFQCVTPSLTGGINRDETYSACPANMQSFHGWVRGGWQEARGGCGVGSFYVENVEEELDSEHGEERLNVCVGSGDAALLCNLHLL